MLSIQPNYSTQTVRKMPVFKGEDSSGPIDDKLYQSKKDYYEGQRIEFENIINDENTLSYYIYTLYHNKLCFWYIYCIKV